MKKTVLTMLLVLCMLGSVALGDTISFSGTVEASEKGQVYAPVSGTVAQVLVREGQQVTADTTLATLKTTKVYAAEDGVIAAVYGQIGDAAEDVTEKYGAVMYLEGIYTYEIEGSISKAYDAVENDLVHSGETVYLVSRAHTNMKGLGTVTAVDSSAYTVLVTEGNFLVGDNISICRDSNYALTSCIGRGNIARIAPVAVTGTGSIVSYAVKAGETVKRGQLLFETVEGTFDGLEMSGAEIKAGMEGVIASLNLEQGSSVTKDSVVATIYPKGAVWVVAEAAEADLRELSVGQRMKVELDWNQDEGVSYEGKVEMISALGTVGTENTTYPVYVSFQPDENTRYSMTALVTTMEAEEANAETLQAVNEENQERNGD